MCESDRLAQKFLRHTNHGCKILINNASELLSPLVKNVMGGDDAKITLPWVFLLIAGFMCSDKSKASSNRSSLKAGMQEGKGKTSETFELLLAFIKKSKPYLIVMENLREIFAMDDSAVISDGIYVCEAVAALGYSIVTWVVAKATATGSAATRIRVYFIAVWKLSLGKALCNDEHEVYLAKDNIKTFINTFHGAFQSCPANPIDFLLPDNVLDGECESDGEPSAKAARKDPDSAKFLEEHMDIFRAYGMTWPPALLDEVDGATITYTNMSRRVREVVYFLHKLHGPLSKANHKAGTVQFIDANLSLKWIMSWSAEKRTGSCKDAWKDSVPALTCQSKMVVRSLSTEGTVTTIKALSGYEHMSVRGINREA
jgi:site-specific DNA-cytosine methylase